MNNPSNTVARLLAGAAMTALAGIAQATDAAAPREIIAPAFAYPIANIPGKTMTALMVSYAPGAKTPAHRHGMAFVVGYVLEGSIRSRLDNGKEQVFHAGESWKEAPGAHHQVSENASGSQPARLLAIFVADSDDNDLVTVDHP